MPVSRLGSSAAAACPAGPATRVRLSARYIGALRPGEVIWDAAVIGFGARRQAGAVTFVLRYRTRHGRQRTYTIGRHGSPWTPDTARAEALRLLSRIVGGEDPSADRQARRGATTVADLCDAYLDDAASGRLLSVGEAYPASTISPTLRD